MKFLSTLFSRPMMVFLGRLLAHPLDQLKKVRQARRDALCIARSGLFDGAWYLGRYSDVADSGLHPLVHYVRRGAYEGRDPNPLFNSRWYLEKNPEVKADGGNPLAHFIRYGVPMGLNPSAYFDLDWYLAQNKSAITAGMHPLRYFLEAGVARGSRPSRHVTALSRWMKDGKNDRLPRVLMIDRIYPRPDRDSGSIDCMNYIGLFREFGYRV
ncbi:MAG: hypothetical protein JXR49_03060, partial [Acidobacteria bacterium]|nr:hypothetical protein [Acidobacteriota bacterium]